MGSGKCLLQRGNKLLFESRFFIASRYWLPKRDFTCCMPALAGQKFRISQGKARDSLQYGPLTDLPDWTYLDGTLPPISRSKVARQKNRIEVSNRVVTFLKDMNAAKAKSHLKKNKQKKKNLKLPELPPN